MNEIKGMAEAFKEARVVYLTTFRDGEVRSRQMTNLNEDPYRMMWFPTVLRDRGAGGVRVGERDGREVAVVVPVLAPGPEEAFLVPWRSP